MTSADITRKVPRPRLEHRPMPVGWRMLGRPGVSPNRRFYQHQASGRLTPEFGDDSLDEMLRFATCMIALLEWEQWERQVRAQDDETTLEANTGR